MDVLEQEKYRQAVWYHVPAITNTQHKQNRIFILLSVSGTFLCHFTCQILKGLFITYPKKLGSKLKFGHFFKLDHYNLIVHNWYSEDHQVLGFLGSCFFFSKRRFTCTCPRCSDDPSFFAWEINCPTVVKQLAERGKS